MRKIWRIPRSYSTSYFTLGLSTLYKEQAPPVGSYEELCVRGNDGRFHILRKVTVERQTSTTVELTFDPSRSERDVSYAKLALCNLLNP